MSGLGGVLQNLRFNDIIFFRIKTDGLYQKRMCMIIFDDFIIIFDDLDGVQMS